MSPDLKKWGPAIAKTILEKSGKTPEETQTLENELKEAVAKKDYAKVTTISAELETHKELAEDLDTVVSDLANVLERHDLANVNVPFSVLSEEETKELTFTQPTEKANKEIRVKERSEISGRRRKPEKYIEDARPIIALSLIEINELASLLPLKRKSFKYKDLESIAKSILVEKQRKNKESIADAKLYTYSVIRNLTKLIPQYAIETNSNNMATLVDRTLSAIKNDGWRNFYLYAKKNYGEMHPKQFSESVILRLPKDVKVAKRFEKIAKKEKALKRIKPRDITPLEELILCNRISDVNIFGRLESFLGEEHSTEILRELGYQDPTEFGRTIMENRKKMAAMRDNVPATNSESINSIKKIVAAIEVQSKGRRGWHKLNPKFIGFSFLGRAASVADGDQAKIQALVDIIFPVKTFQVDAKDSFRVIGIEEQPK